MADVQAAVGTADNPVVLLSISGTAMTVTFADGTVDTLTLPAGGGGGVDQTARDAAAAAQTAAGTAQTDIDDHEANHPGGGGGTTDQTARDAAAAAQTAADGAQTDIDDHEANHPTGGGGGTTDQTARDAAAAAQTAADGAQTDIDDHEANHPTGGGGGDPVTPTPPTTLVDSVAYESHGDVEIVGWRDFDFIQFMYTATNGNTYPSDVFNTGKLIALSPFVSPMGRNVQWTFTIDATDDDVIAVSASAGNAVPAPSTGSTLTVIGWYA